MTELEIAKRCAASMLNNDKASHALGIEVDITAAGAATVSMTVRDDMLNGFGVCHGGMVFALADSAFAFACNAYDEQTVAASCQVEFLRPARKGDKLTANASEDHRGRKTGYYTVTVHNQDDELVALFRGRSRSNGNSVL